MSTVSSPPGFLTDRTLARQLADQAKNIQMLPEAANQAIAAADDPESSIRDLADIISQDVKLATSILSLANSPLFPMFASDRNVSCLRTAVTRLGFRQTKQTILIACFSCMLRSMRSLEIKIRQAHREHGLLTGIICTNLNALFRLGMQGEEFTAGLLHDVGTLLLFLTIPEKYGEFDQLEFKEPIDYLTAEKRAVGINHTDVGAWFLKQNRVPNELISVASYHHTPDKPRSYRKLVSLVSVADQLANHHQCPERPDKIDTESMLGLQILEWLGVENAAAKFSEGWQDVLAVSLEQYASLSNI